MPRPLDLILAGAMCAGFAAILFNLYSALATLTASALLVLP